MTEPITPELRQQPFTGHGWAPPVDAHPHPPAKRRRRWPWVLGIAIAGLTGIAVGSASQTDRAESDVAKPTPATKTVAAAPETVTATATARPETTAAAPAGPLTQFSSGTFEVGTDIKAGKYKTTGPDKSGSWPSCYWARNKDSSGSFESIIANGNVEGPGTVTVNAGEVFQASGSCVWQLAP